MVELQNYMGLAEQLVVDTSETQPTYLLIGKSGRPLRLSSSAYFLLRHVYQGDSFEEIAQKISQFGGTPCTPQDLATAYTRIMARLTEIETTPETNRSGFWLRIRCIPQASVQIIARWLTGFFHPVIASIVLLMIVVSLWLMFQIRLPTHIQPQTFGIAYLIFFCSVLVHEFGHASACLRYGAVPGDIGFAVYWIYPILYSDVSTAWMLKRWQRVVVDLGGVFFQLAFFGICIILFSTTHWEPAYVATQMILSSVLFSINPILKFDGYWVLADTFGITNLGQQTGKIWGYVMASLRGKPTPILPWTTGPLIFMVLYTLASIGFWGFFLWWLLPFFWVTMIRYPETIIQLIEQIRQYPAIFPSQAIGQVFVSTFVLCISMIMSYRFIAIVISPLWQLFLHDPRSPKHPT